MKWITTGRKREMTFIATENIIMYKVVSREEEDAQVRFT